MKVTSMKTVMKKLAFSLLVGGGLLSGSVRADDIVSIKSDQATQTFTSSGEYIDFKVSLDGYFVLTNAFMGSTSFMPELRMIVNGDLAYATLDSLSQYKLGGLFDRTDCYFRYRVKPGDMAQPLRIYGGPTTPYQINWKGWAVRNATNLTADAVWVFDPAKSKPGLGEVYDIDLSKAKITIRTLSFDDANSPASVAATETITWRATSVNPTESAVVSFYVWTPGTNIVQLGTVPNQTWLLVQMPTNTTYKDFAIKGLAVGSTEIYLQRPVDYANNFTAIGVTNYIKKTLTVSAPPEPTVRVIMTDTATDNVTLDETTSLNTGSFELQLSQAFSNDVWVRVDTTPVNQSNLTFSSSPYLVKIPSGSDRSSVQKFSVPDGTAASAGAGITMSPVVVSNAAAVSFYTRLRDARVYVRNVKPLITQPLATDTPTAIQHTPYTFSWNTADVVPDMDSGMTITWIFGDGTTNYVTHGSAGTVQHTYTGSGNKVVKVRAKDKDGAESDEVQFVISVSPPVAQPNVRLSPNLVIMAETATANTGSFDIYLSEPYSLPVQIQLITDPLVQSNIVFASTNVVTISPGMTNAPIPQRYSLRDGTDYSGNTGIRVTPVVVNAAASHFTGYPGEAFVFVTNMNPVVVSPAAGDVLAPAIPPYDSVYMGTPFTFDYIVSDVPADLSTMRVRWNFGDGFTLTVTGAVGAVSHTYTSLGNKYVWVEAEDKDGGISQRNLFKITVVSPPPPPTVSILPPSTNVSPMVFESITPRNGYFGVQLSEAFTNQVTVRLATTPANSLVNGGITLDQTLITFQVGEVYKVVNFSALDGTALSLANGFTVTPTVVSSPTAVTHYTGVGTALITIGNKNPVINNPVSSDLTGAAVYQVAQGSPATFYWDVSDVANDVLSSPAQYAMSNTWYFGDNSSATVFGGAGSITHTYTTIGDVLVYFIARDKDGGFSEVRFKITVLPAKAVNVTPIGPSGLSPSAAQGGPYGSADYYGMKSVTGRSPDGGGGLGFGVVRSLQAQGWDNRDNTYFFRYSPSDVSVTLEAIPYKVGVVPNNYYFVTNNYNSFSVRVTDTTRYYCDSFFFVWMGEDQGIAASKLLPETTTASTTISLPASTDTGSGTDTRDVSAVFSREYYIKDNVGDINCDGIPDDSANWILSQLNNSGGGATADSTPAWLTDLSTYNDDYDKPNGTSVGDFLPLDPDGANGTYDFRPIANPNVLQNGLSVNAFTAIIEVRGYHKGLNRPFVSDSDLGSGEPKGDEPRTNPTLIDTDGDGFLDGWEYWFWYQSGIKGMVGSSYNPANPAVGTVIPSSTISVYFDPITYQGDNDLDNDGVMTSEEMIIGTNPVNWDTDGDGASDGFELFYGSSPTAIGGLNDNPDSDFMAIASVPRQMVILSTAGGVVISTNLIPNIYGLSGTANVPDPLLTNKFTTLYYYGSEQRLAVGRPVILPAGARYTVINTTEALVLHYQVAEEFGFDPRTAWAASMNMHPDFDRFPAWISAAPYTQPFTTRDEYYVVQFLLGVGANGLTNPPAASAATWSRYTTHPHTPDTDYDYVTQTSDGMPDGWELYVAVEPGAANRTTLTISPWVVGDGIANHPRQADRDGLNNLREFSGTDSVFAYSNPQIYNDSNALQVVSIVRQTTDQYWFNKFWPSNPWKPDTDNDGLSDSAETAFTYGSPTDNNSTLIQGGGLNPNAIDTDLDALPDKWEQEFTGTLPGSGNGTAYGGIVSTNGMDGTFKDATGGALVRLQNNSIGWSYDWDNDGLLNYQEYWVQAVRSLRYDIPQGGVAAGPMTGNAGLAMTDGYTPWSLFTPVTNVWDLSKYPWGDAGPQLTVLLPVGWSKLSVSTDPRDPDTDGDSMDDYYEMFHGLNPILGYSTLADATDDRIKRAYVRRGLFTIDYGSAFLGNDWGNNLLMDAVNYPWLAGMPMSDPDADGLLNLEEQLLSNTAAPQNYNTDPSPLWLTDAANNQSVTRRFYRPYKLEKATQYLTFFWPHTQTPSYTFGFEMNEGYDTDNDGVSDKSELVDSRNPMSSPQDHDDPLRRQALWFSGTNSAASTVAPFNQYLSGNPLAIGDFQNAFRSFTIELWVRPMSLTEQVIVDRGFFYGPSDASTTNAYVRRNYQIGITDDGHVYASFDNAGAWTHDFHTARALAVGHTIRTNVWTHIAARMSGAAQTLTLFVNGEIQDVVATALIPANGVDTLPAYPTGLGSNIPIYTPGSMTLGAANDEPGDLSIGSIFSADWTWTQSWSSFSKFYHGWLDEVRIWDGARENEDIRSDMSKRYSHNDLWENRALVAERIQRGYTRVAGDSMQLPPLLMYHYTFDNLFSAMVSNSVAQAPRGFEYLAEHICQTNITTLVETNYVVNVDLSVTTNIVSTTTTNVVMDTFPNVVEINRPTTPGADAQVYWWANSPVRSVVYKDYKYLPWIENAVDHLPIFGGASLSSGSLANLGTNGVSTAVTTNSAGGNVLYMTNSVRDSVYWKHTGAGAINSTNYFPNRCDPYGFYYIPYHYFSSDSLDMGTDLLPLGDAFAKQVPEMWDAHGASSAWLETGTDSDADGLADWWELLHTNCLNVISWDDFSSTDLTYGELYQRDVAYGWVDGDTASTGPTGYRQTADSDADGMFDWWERLYNLDYSYPNGAKGQNGAGGDPDLDGLSNLAEFQISEVYTNFQVHLSPILLKTHSQQPVTDYYLRVGNLTFGAMFSDHDFMEDWWEDEYDPYYVNRFVFDPTLDYDEDGWSNWAECRYERAGRKSDPTLGMHLYPTGESAKDFPVPFVETRISYDGIRQMANIVVEAYSDREMDGLPDAVFNLPAPGGQTTTVKTKNLGFWGSRKITGYLSPGSVVPGTIEIDFTETVGTHKDETVTGAYDRFDEAAGTTGLIYGQDGSGWQSAIGTIDYETGYFEIDLTWYDGVTLVQQVSATQTYVVNPVTAYMVVNYEVTTVASWPKTLYFTDADMGYLREGPNYFFAYMDVDNNNAWSAGEPCGVATPFMTDINWHYNHVNIQLTDYTKGYLRMTLQPPVRSEDIYWGTTSGQQPGGPGGQVTLGLQNRVRVRRTVVNGWSSYQKVVLDKVLDLRTYLHEGDFLGQGDLGLDWGIKGAEDLDRTLIGYEVFVGDAAVLTNNAMIMTFTNRYDVEQAKAVCNMPINGAYVYASRPTFRWSMPSDYTAFAIEVRKGSPFGPQIYWSGEQQVPVRHEINGECEWLAPIHAGDRLMSGHVFSTNTVYAWRVTALNPKFTLSETVTTSDGCEPCGETTESTYSSDTTWSDWKMFRLDINAPMVSSGYGEISAMVKYFGTAKKLTDRVRVQVYDNQGFTGVPVAQCLINPNFLGNLGTQEVMEVNAVLRGLAPSSVVGDYYVRAFIDSNMNGVRDAWESWGYANYYMQSDRPYTVRPFSVAFENSHSQQEMAVIYIEDSDSDQDWFPDVYEYEQNPDGDFLALMGPVGVETQGETEINPGLVTDGPFWGAGSIFAALALGTTDQDGDGLNDMTELMLGTDASNSVTAHDGYQDGDKVDLGLAPQDVLRLAVTDVAASGTGAALQWMVSVERSGTIDRKMLSTLLGVSGTSTVSYYIDYTPSLLQPAWVTVRTGTIVLDGTKTIEGQFDTSVIDLSQGFFRVRLAK